MKIGELLDVNTTYDIYDFGESYYVKLFEERYDRGKIISEFEKSIYINSVFNNCPKGKEVVELDDRTGIVYKKEVGETFLYLMEESDISIDYEAERFAFIHAEMHKTKCDTLIDQKSFFTNHINICEDITDDEKQKLKVLLNELPTGENLCHGNYHLNNVLLNDKEYKILNIGSAYKGHPMSDVAKACIILDVPRYLSDASQLLQEELIKIRIKFMTLYLDYYQKCAPFDEDLCIKFYKLAAVVRLNEKIENEKEWLLNVIRN
ncbi:MAG: hypothetical protein JEZ08_23750 [Clostridiales bacterium]|nr:hypothetical protein [Clostridiales bacterium]